MMRAKRFLREKSDALPGRGLSHAETCVLQDRVTTMLDFLRSGDINSVGDGLQMLSRLLKHLARRTKQPLPAIYDHLRRLPVELDYFGSIEKEVKG